MIELEIPSAVQGHATITIEETNPAERAKLAEQVTKMIREGHLVFVRLPDGETRRVQGYDPQMNTWILHRSVDPKSGSFPAADTTASVVAQSAGG